MCAWSEVSEFDEKLDVQNGWIEKGARQMSVDKIIIETILQNLLFAICLETATSQFVNGDAV